MKTQEEMNENAYFLTLLKIINDEWPEQKDHPNALGNSYWDATITLHLNQKSKASR